MQDIIDIAEEIAAARDTKPEDEASFEVARRALYAVIDDWKASGQITVRSASTSKVRSP